MSLISSHHLDLVFDELNREKILAEQCFTVYGYCESLSMELFKQVYKNPEFDGYCFYDEYDRYLASKNGLLYIKYKSNDQSYNSEKLANIIIEIFKKYGFETEWNGSIKNRILIKLPQIIIDKLNSDIEEENKQIHKFLQANQSEFDEDFS